MRQALDILQTQGDTIYITAQNLVEFRALATRPIEANGLGWTPEQTTADSNLIKTLFPLLPESPLILEEWEALVDAYSIIGRQVYDARLVAVMKVYGVSSILTMNPTHFRRFTEITVITPDDLITS